MRWYVITDTQSFKKKSSITVCSDAVQLCKSLKLVTSFRMTKFCCFVECNVRTLHNTGLKTHGKSYDFSPLITLIGTSAAWLHFSMKSLLVKTFHYGTVADKVRPNCTVRTRGVFSGKFKPVSDQFLRQQAPECPIFVQNLILSKKLPPFFHFFLFVCYKKIPQNANWHM